MKDSAAQPNIQDNATQPTEQDATLAEGPEVHSELSKVAANPKRNIVIMGMVGLVLVYLVMQLFSSGKKPTDTSATAPVPIPASVAKPAPAVNDESKSGAPAIPDLPKLSAPQPPNPVAPAVPTANNTSVPALQPSSAPSLQSAQLPIASTIPSLSGVSEEDKKREEAKKKSGIVLFGGKETTKTAAEIEAQKDFTLRGDMSYILGKGKIIEAVLETAINSDFGGDVRAVIVRDVFAEDGKLILIPKGSHVFGAYTTGGDVTTGRIDIGWSRIDLNNGYSLNLKGDTVDNLGRKGITGRIDNKYKEQLTNAILTSAFNIGFAAALDKAIPPPATSATAAQSAAQTAQINTAMATAIANNTGPASQAQITAICGAVQPLVPATSAAYATISTACTTALTPLNPPNWSQNLQNLQTAITGATANLSQVSATTTTPTQTQSAATDAFKSVTKSVQSMVDQNNFKPTVTIDQGKPVKIYVNKDYVFPKAAVGKSKVIK